LRGLTKLGFRENYLTLVREILSRSRGIVLMTGPTGAGKTTTQIKQAAVSAGMNTLPADALAKAIFAQTTIEEVNRVA
jgi:type II secretory ATPase GspE/PulE/Tfp pilus assembly ATPase PilB-like protein